ncbi:NAD(P)-binding protein [Phanerochaete sordida]|uniref:NAD(P)-binding protein n=1 Tax=Phanerochaete sordida TaxID=48140 RepID=A0A9P3G7A0_9APHY|nr:NAD(P)-binding protein [Phanerochaete sordida]
MGNSLSIYASIFRSLFPPAPKFLPQDVPDLTGRVIVVTGGASGIGKETVKVFLEHNAKVYLATRNRSQAEAVIAELKAATGNEAHFLPLDLANLAAVRAAAEEFLSKEHELHVLFNNAGTMWCPLEQLTADGFDMQFGTNVVGHVLLTTLLLPALAAGARSAPDGRARVVNTSSCGALLATGLRFETFRGVSALRTRLGTKDMYNQSKLAMAVWSREAARRYADKNVLVYAVDPGSVKTGLQRNATWMDRLFLNMILHEPWYGALTQLWAGTSPETLSLNGEWLIPYARHGRCLPEMYDAQLGEKLWTWLEEQLQEK